jgi:hypothetical protein
MKCITLCVLFSWLCLYSFGQIDTTKKPIDTTKKPIDTTQNVDTVLAPATDTVTVDTTVAVMDITENKSRRRPPIDHSLGPVYKLKPAVDIPYTIAATAFSLWGFSNIYNKPSSTEAQINSLRTSDINGFDRWAAEKWDEKADKNSDMLFYASMPAPLLLLLDADIRKDALKVIFLYWETMGTTGIFYTGSASIWDRYRPFVYNEAVPMHERTNGNAKNSFLGGHPALVATSTFFIAKVYSDYHPDSRIKWLFYTGAATATLTTAYLRHKAGKHFPSDLIVGTTIGTLNGILVPHFHKNKLFKKKNITLLPYSAGQHHGMYMTYKF